MQNADADSLSIFLGSSDDKPKSKKRRVDEDTDERVDDDMRRTPTPKGKKPKDGKDDRRSNIKIKINKVQEVDHEDVEDDIEEEASHIDDDDDVDMPGDNGGYGALDLD